VIQYLEKVNKEDAKVARKRYGTLNRYRGNESQYGIEVVCQMTPSREQEVVNMLMDMYQKGREYISSSGGDEYFWELQNARLVKDAEEYYRKSYMGGNVTWNLRDNHMFENLKNLITFYEDKSSFCRDKSRSSGKCVAKAVLWAHNSHLGDARATEYGFHEYNLGQLIRQEFGLENSFSVGFTTFTGTVRAAKKWGGPGEVFSLTIPDEDTYEYLLHDASSGGANFIVILRSLTSDIITDKKAIEILMPARYERMIGVQYAKKTERQSHYVKCTLPKQFDALVHFDCSSALIPLD